MSYTNTFIKQVLEHSVSNTWEEAKREWHHIGSHLEPESNCICGHEILEVCNIENNINGAILNVGNVCVRKFMGIDRRHDFKLIKKELIDSQLFSELIYNDVLTNWEVDFYNSIKRKRKLSNRQLELKYDIIYKAKDYVMKKKPKGTPDPYVFKQLKETMNIKQEHRAMLGKFIIEQGYKIAKGKNELSFEEVFETLKETIIQVKKLKDHYEK